MRRITLSPTSGTLGEEENAPLHVYDTSGAYTDANMDTDIRQGLEANRLNWINEISSYVTVTDYLMNLST